MMACAITGVEIMKNDNFRCGYRDALLGDEFILEDMPTSYYDGVAKAKREKTAAIDWYEENLTYL
jgi:hypothetical protein